MTPTQVADDPAVLVRFQNEVAYRDGRPRDPAVVRYDADVLSSPGGLLAVAWLWPDQSFAPDVDPFELVADSSPDEWCARLAAQVQHAMRVARDAVVAHGESDSVDDIVRYLMWQADLSEGDVVRLRRGEVDQLAVWVRICRCLHLDFDGGWRISDPARLAKRIDQAWQASRTAKALKHIPTGKLRDLWRKLPPTVIDPVPRIPLEVYRAPKGRYRALYLALTQDRRSSPTYKVADINAILARQGEAPLPPSATRDPSWWAGRGTKTEGRPQVAAWWAAGYRVAEEFGSLALRQDLLVLLPDDREPTAEERAELSAITGVRFESLPGRAEWLANEDRIEQGEYRMPESVLVPVAPLNAPSLLSAHVDELLLDHQRPTDVLEWVPEPEPEPNGPHAPEGRAQDVDADVDVDVDVATLIRLLESAGEMDREQIGRELRSVARNSPGRHGPGDAGSDLGSSSDVKSLLTRARRRGLITNYGTNRKPRWVAVGSKGDLVLQMTRVLKERRSSDEQPTVEVPKVGPGDEVPVGFLAQVATCLDLGTPPHAADVELARAIVESAGGDWSEDAYCNPQGELTRDGLQAVSNAVVGKS